MADNANWLTCILTTANEEHLICYATEWFDEDILGEASGLIYFVSAEQ